MKLDLTTTGCGAAPHTNTDLPTSRQAAVQPLLTTTQASDLIGITIEELRRLRRRGQGPEWGRLGRIIRYDQNDVTSWLGTTAGDNPDA